MPYTYVAVTSHNHVDATASVKRDNPKSKVELVSQLDMGFGNLITYSFKVTPWYHGEDISTGIDQFGRAHIAGATHGI